MFQKIVNEWDLVTDFKAYENLIFGYHDQEPYSKSSILKENDILIIQKKLWKNMM